MVLKQTVDTCVWLGLARASMLETLTINRKSSGNIDQEMIGVDE